MTFREMIQLYQEGALEDPQKELVKNEIEKHEAISDYLYEASQIPDIEELGGIVTDNAESQDAVDFSKMVRKAIRRAFIKTGIIVGGAILAIVLAVIFLLPDFVSLFYYNPNEVVGYSSSANETNRMSLELAVYSELFLPETYRETVIAEEMGYGKYSITIPQTISYTGNFSTVAGVLDRNKLTLYDPNLLREIPGNGFTVPKNVYWEHRNPFPIGLAREEFDKLQMLDDDAVYAAYFSLDALTDYETIYEQVGTAWYAVYNDQTYYAGFWSAVNGSLFDWDQEKYPLLSTLRSGGSIEEIDANAASADAMKTHFLSMLQYMKDHPETMKLFGKDNLQLNETIQYVEANGLQIYGFMVIGDKETILKQAEAENIAYVYTSLHQ